MHFETYNRSMHAETVEMLRFTDEEVEEHRDGIRFPNLGITGMKLFFARFFTGRSFYRVPKLGLGTHFSEVPLHKIVM